MRISYKLHGEEELLRRLTSLAELPGLDLALDQAAERSFEAARTHLAAAGEIGIANSLVIDNNAAGNRQITSRHPRAWFAENGTRARPALRWLEKAAGDGGKFLRQALVRAVARPHRHHNGKEGR